MVDAILLQAASRNVRTREKLRRKVEQQGSEQEIDEIQSARNAEQRPHVKRLRYLNYILDLLHEVPALTYRKMMGEYMLYSDGVLFGGVYDNRFLLKDVPAAREAFSTKQVPYEGAKPMLLVDSENPTLIAAVVDAMLPQLPLPKKKK